MFRLKELRQRKGISQIKLAMDLNMAQNTISRYETEAREADYETLIRFADYFDTSIDYLLGRTENPYFARNYNYSSYLKPVNMVAEDIESLNNHKK